MSGVPQWVKTFFSMKGCKCSISKTTKCENSFMLNLLVDRYFFLGVKEDAH